MTSNLFSFLLLISFLLDVHRFPLVANGQTYEDCENGNAVYCDDDKPDKIAVCLSKASKKGGLTAKTSCVTPSKKVKKGVTVECGCCDEEITKSSKKSSSKKTTTTTTTTTTGSSSSKKSKKSPGTTPDYCPTSIMPSGSEIPSEVPSEMPSEWPSEFPTASGGVSSTDAPSGAPTSDCVDNPNFTHQGDNSKDCDWVAERPDNRCKKEWKQISVKVWCPVTCDHCDKISSNIFSLS